VAQTLDFTEKMLWLGLDLADAMGRKAAGAARLFWALRA
jgi:hypothetical protein